MSDHRPSAASPRQAAPDAVKVAAGAAVVALVILAAFQTMGDRPGTAAEQPIGGAAAPDWPAGLPLRQFQDPELGLRITMPASWERALDATGSDSAEASPPDQATTFVDAATGAHLSIALWRTGGRAPFNLWLGVVAGGMAPAGHGSLPNATLAGQPAAVLWRPDDAGAPSEIAAFVERPERYLRIRYQAGVDGKGVSEDELRVVRAVLASVGWTGVVDGESRVPHLALDDL